MATYHMTDPSDGSPNLFWMTVVPVPDKIITGCAVRTVAQASRRAHPAGLPFPNAKAQSCTLGPVNHRWVAPVIDMRADSQAKQHPPHPGYRAICPGQHDWMPFCASSLP